MSKNKGLSGFFIPIVILAATALVYVSPILSNMYNIGVADWDSHLFFYGVPVRTILRFGQFPLWNPYYCGGNAMLANPESPFLAPPFVFALLFGEVVGVKLIIAFYAVIGMWGMYCLSRTLGFAKASSMLPPVIFIMSSWFALRVSEGHSSFLPYALMPFVAAFYIRSFEDGFRLKYAVLGAFFFAWMLFAGGVYQFIATALFLSLFCILKLISMRKIGPVASLVAIVMAAFLLTAVKSIPQFEFVKAHPRHTEATEFHSPGILKDSLFSRSQRATAQGASYYMKAGEEDGRYLKGFWGGARPWGWHEYGAFIGFGAFALYLAGFVFFRRTWIWIIISVFALLLSLGDFSPINIWAIVRKLPVFSSIHGPSRLMPVFVFTLSVIAGYVLSRFEDYLGAKKKIAALAGASVIVLIIFIEIATVTRPVLKDAFTEPPLDLAENRDFRQLVVKEPTRMGYPDFLMNIGTVNCYETIRPPIKVAPYGDDSGNLNPAYRGEAYLLNGQGKAEVRYFSPNKVVVEVDALAPDRLILNQNYFKGWRVKTASGKADAASYNGVVSAEVGAGKSEVAFHYSPSSFKIGLLISAIAFIVSAFILILRPRL